ncbi:MAG: hypothetical protein RJB09_2730 [Pseudomonadota bacterium]
MQNPPAGPTRRKLMAALLTVMAAPAAVRPASAQAKKPAAPVIPRFDYEDVVARARELSESAFQPRVTRLPPELDQLDWDAWRVIRFRNEPDPIQDPTGRYKLGVFHLGHLFKTEVKINLVVNGATKAFDYSPKNFEYAQAGFGKNLPANLGYAGFRISFPLNSAKTFDELISFVGASYFRFLGRDQKYGLSARGLAIGSGNLDNNEEFPFFREFWIEQPAQAGDKITIYALLDTPSLAGAYQFDIYPQDETALNVTASVYPRVPVKRLGMAPLTSMFLMGENDRHMNDRNKYDEFRPELHDSDGLMIHTDAGGWLWRPLKNPLIQEVQRFRVNGLKGFGLMQRDRDFKNYTDIELAYEERPSYWIEPTHDWGTGEVELIELATKDETADNIVCAFVPDGVLEPGKRFTFGYKIRSMHDGLSLHKLGYVRETFNAPPAGLGGNEAVLADARRLIVDFTGGDLAYYLKHPDLVRIVAHAQRAQVVRSFLVPNPKIGGFRAMIDVKFEHETVGTIQCLLQAEGKQITENWQYAWRIYNL